MVHKKEDKSSTNVLKYSFWAGISLIVLTILNIIFLSILSNANSLLVNIYEIIYNLISLAVSVLFMYGFVILGKKYNNNFLKTSTIILIIGLFLSLLLNFIFITPASSNFQKMSLEAYDKLGIDPSVQITTEQSSALYQLIINDPIFFSSLKIILICSLISGIYFILATIFFSIGLIKLKEVRFAKLTGIITLIGMILVLLLIIGIFLLTLGLYLAGVLLTFFGFLGILAIGAGVVFEFIIIYNESKK